MPGSFKFWVFTFTIFAIVACGVRQFEEFPVSEEDSPEQVKSLVHCSCTDSREWDEAK